MTSLMTLNHCKNQIYVIIASLKSETMGKLKKMNTRFASFDIKLSGSALNMHSESLGKPRDVNKRSQSLAW